MRPLFHFTARTGWINDPHAVTARDGGYDVFYQYAPDSVVWAADCSWGHARGPDLLSLMELPAAIMPGDGDDGIWTGSLAQHSDGEATIFYTSVRQPDIGIGTVRSATPVDRTWTTWHKGPVVATVPGELDVVAYRDPFVTRVGEGWGMFLGVGLAGGTAAALRYSSPDLKTWAYDGIALKRSAHLTTPIWMGALWECPQFFELDGCSVMISSVWDDDVLYYAGYSIGDWDDQVFVARHWGQLSFGPSYYAPSFFRDAEGRPCVLFWMRGVQDPDAGWAGAHSVAYVLGVEDDRLTLALHPDIAAYVRPALDPAQPVAGLAALVEWMPESDSAWLQVASGGSRELRAALVEGELRITRADEIWSMPYDRGLIRVILDGPIVEVACSTGVFGIAIAPAGETFEVDTSGPAVAVHPLSRG